MSESTHLPTKEWTPTDLPIKKWLRLAQYLDKEWTEWQGPDGDLPGLHHFHLFLWNDNFTEYIFAYVSAIAHIREIHCRSTGDYVKPCREYLVVTPNKNLPTNVSYHKQSYLKRRLDIRSLKPGQQSYRFEKLTNRMHWINCIIHIQSRYALSEVKFPYVHFDHGRQDMVLLNAEEKDIFMTFYTKHNLDYLDCCKTWEDVRLSI